MKNKIAAYTAVLMLLFISCRTTLQYPAIVPNSLDDYSSSIITGYFVSEKNGKNDIIIQQVSFSAFNVPSFTDMTNEITTWSGKIIIGDKENTVKIQVWLGRFKSNENALSYAGKKEPWAMNIKIKEMPEVFKIKEFKLSNGQRELFKENNKEISQFTVNGVVFSVSVDNGNEYRKLSVMQRGDSKLYIMNNSSVPYADLDMVSYRIYRSDNSITVEQLQSILAVFSIIQHLVVVLW